MTAVDLQLAPRTTALVEVVRRAAGEPSPARVRSALTAVGWDDLLGAARLHGIEGTVGAVVLRDAADLVSDEAAEDLRELRRGVAARSLLMSRQALAVIDLLRRGGVRAMLYKGPALSEPMYGDVAARSWCDIDLIVAADDVPAAAKALVDGGLTADAGGVALGADMLASEQEMGFRHAPSGLALDLHWRVGLRFAGGALDGEDLLARAVPGEVLERPVLVPSLGDTALLTAVHAAHHTWEQLDHVLTMALALESLAAAGPEASDAVVEVARRSGCARRLRIGVLLVRAIAGVTAPRPLADDAVVDRRARRLAASAGADLLWRIELEGERRAGRRPHSHAREVLWQLSSLDSSAASLRHGAARLLRPGARDTGVGPAAGRAGDSSERAAGGAVASGRGTADRGGAAAVETLRAVIRRQRRIWG